MKLLGKEDSRGHSAAGSIPTPTPRLNPEWEAGIGFPGEEDYVPPSSAITQGDILIQVQPKFRLHPQQVC